LAVARGADRCAALRRQVLRRSVGVRAVVVHCDYARPHAAPNLLHALAKADGRAIWSASWHFCNMPNDP
jgi:hypothetical protein